MFPVLVIKLILAYSTVAAALSAGIVLLNCLGILR